MSERPVLSLKAPPSPAPTSETVHDLYMVWTKTGWAPRKAHRDFASASTEAKRLARLHPGKKFIVLKAVAKFGITPSENRGVGVET